MNGIEGWRKDVAVRDVPYRWSTNLSDDEIRDLYDAIQQDYDLAAKMLLGDGNAIGITGASFDVPFLDGVCWCLGFLGHFYAVYRTHLGWEIQAARKAELDELRKAQEEEQQIEIILFLAQDTHHCDQMMAAFSAEDYVRAERLLRLRAANRRDSEHEKVRELFYYFVQNGGLERLLCFPTLDPALRFLADFDLPSFRYTFLANLILARPDARTMTERLSMCDQVFERACERFPEHPFLFKDACLIFQRHGAVSLAIKFCRLAVRLNLRDDTKTGFLGRLSRLERQQHRTVT